MLRRFTCIGGIAFAVLGAAGLLGLLGIGVGEAVLYLLTGVLFSYVGFGRWPAEAIRGVVGGIGTLYLFSGALVFAALFVLGLPVEGRDVLRVALGVFYVLGAWFLPCEGDASAGH